MKSSETKELVIGTLESNSKEELACSENLEAYKSVIPKDLDCEDPSVGDIEKPGVMDLGEKSILVQDNEETALDVVQTDGDIQPSVEIVAIEPEQNDDLEVFDQRTLTKDLIPDDFIFYETGPPLRDMDYQWKAMSLLH